MSWSERCAHIFKVRVSPLKNWRSFLPPPSLRERTVSSDPLLWLRPCFSSFFFSGWSVLLVFASLALVVLLFLRREPLFPRFCRSSRPAPLRTTVLLPLFALVLSSLSRSCATVQSIQSVQSMSINVNQSLADSKSRPRCSPHTSTCTTSVGSLLALFMRSRAALRCSLTCAGRTPASLVDGGCSLPQ